jgi:hypothetical protein
MSAKPTSVPSHPVSRADVQTRAYPDRPRKLRGDDDDDGNEGRPRRNELYFLIRDFVREHYGPVAPMWAREDSEPTRAVGSAIHRAIPDVTGALLEAPYAEDAFSDLARNVREQRADEQGRGVKLSTGDRRAIDYFRRALVDVDARLGTLHWLQMAVEHVAKMHLTQSEAAQLAAALTRQAALSTGRKPDTHTTTDAASGRLQVIADQFEYLSTEQQQRVAALVAGLADSTPERTKHLRGAVRKLIDDLFTTDDLVYFGQCCIEFLRRRAGDQSSCS